MRGNTIIGSGLANGEDGVRVKTPCEFEENEFVNLARGPNSRNFRDHESLD